MTRHGIESIRLSLGFAEREESLLREAAPRLIPEVPRWVDEFYTALVVDPAAMPLLKDEATVIRLKRSLNAWFLEMFSLPYDEAYERARSSIGRTHVRIEMPQHLMVTAMGGIRRAAVESVSRIWADDPEAGRRVLKAIEMVLDMELALMLEQYRRRARELAHAADRSLFTQGVARRLAGSVRSAVDAALCYAELLAGARNDGERERFAARLAEAMKGIARLGERATEAVPDAVAPPETAPLADLCARALADVSLPAHTHVVLSIEPPGLVFRVHRAPLEQALEEVLQSAVNRDPGGNVRLLVRATEGGLVLEVTDAGPGWPAGVRDVEDAAESEFGADLAHAEYAAELHSGTVQLFAPAGGGAGVRLRLGPARTTKENADANLVEGPGRGPP